MLEFIMICDDCLESELSTNSSLRDRLDAYERELIETFIDAAQGNITEASRQLQIDPGNLHRKMKRLGIHHQGTGRTFRIRRKKW